MDINKLERISDSEWKIDAHAGMRVPAVIFASQSLIGDMDDKVYEQVPLDVDRVPGLGQAQDAGRGEADAGF